MPATDRETLPESIRRDAQTLWHYHRLDDELHPVDVAIGLGSHDPGVATYTADLYHRGLFPLVVFTGANAPTTVERFPRGEAVHYREIAIEHGMPTAAILTEPRPRTPARTSPSRANCLRPKASRRGLSF